MTTTQQRLKIGDYIAFLRHLGYDFKLNSITDQIEVNGVILTDEFFSKIEYQMIETGCNIERYLRVAIGSIAYDNRYNPVKDYLSRLAYDGKNYFQEMISCFDNPDHLAGIYLYKWMLGAIAKTVEGQQNRMLIFDGPQGAGKSLFVKWLCSGIPGYFTEGSIDTDSKDTFMRLTTKWIWEVGELGATFRKSDREALKNLITMQNMTYRQPYGRYEKTKPILANMIGTINNEGGFLDDPTGNRRFMICEVRNINWKKYTQIDVNKVWGEIYAAYLIGENTEFSDDEKIKIEKNNRNYEVEDPIELVILDQYDINPGDITKWTTTADLTYVIQEKLGRGGSSPKGFQMSLASTCKKLGLQKGQQKNQRGYYGIQKKFP